MGSSPLIWIFGFGFSLVWTVDSPVAPGLPRCTLTRLVSASVTNRQSGEGFRLWRMELPGPGSGMGLGTDADHCCSRWLVFSCRSWAIDDMRQAVRQGLSSTAMSPMIIPVVPINRDWMFNQHVMSDLSGNTAGHNGRQRKGRVLASWLSDI